MHLTRPPAVSRRPWCYGAVTRILAGQPLVPEEVDLVLLCGLERDARVGVARHVHQRQRPLRPICQVVRAPLTRVRVVPDAIALPAPRVLLPGTRRAEEPEAVA